MNTKSITGIVLAGGRSSRMGSDKSLIKLKDKSLIEYAIDTLKPLCSKVVISSNNLIYDFTGCEVWRDELPHRAPMIGIYSCLKRSESDVNIILSCDMPLMSREMLEYLLENSMNHDITVPMHEDSFIEPLCGIYKRWSIEILEKYINRGNFRLNECIQAGSHQLVLVGSNLSFFSPELFSNVNSPEDLRNINQIH